MYFLECGHANLVRVTVDEFGIDVDAIEKICRKKRSGRLYHFASSLSDYRDTLIASRRIKLLSLAEKYGFIIIEDDYDYDFHFLSSPILPLVSADPKGMIIYIGTFSKTIALLSGPATSWRLRT